LTPIPATYSASLLLLSKNPEAFLKEIATVKPEKDGKPAEILDDLEPSKKVRQSVKVLGRTVFCFACIGKEPSSKETAAFYCGCGSFLCTYHVIVHKCLVTSSMEFDKELLASLT
jgi:hypothetical protein